MKDFHSWMKTNHPSRLDEFVATPQAPAGGVGKSVVWLMSTAKNMLQNDPQGLTQLIQGLIDLRKDLMGAQNAPTQPAVPQPDMATNPNARTANPAGQF